MQETEKMKQGKLYNPFELEIPTWKEMRPYLKAFNNSAYWEDKKPLEELRKKFKKSYDDISLIPPFYCDHGINISIGKHFQGNTGIVILDEAEVIIGDDVLMGPRVSIYTVSHPIEPTIRKMDLEFASNVVIEDGVWIGGNVIINPGVTIGKNSIIGSGSVVTKDIPSHVIAVGNPCHVLREIHEEDHEYWMKKYKEYQNE